MYVECIGQKIYIMALSVYMFDKITLIFVLEKSKTLSVNGLKW